MAIQGIFSSYDGIVGERAGDFASAILMYFPTGSAPLLALSSGMESKPANDVVFHWFEDSHISGRSAVVSGTTTTTVVVADGSFYPPGTILLVEETGEHMMVTAASGNSLTVIRGLGGTSIASVSGSNFVQKIGNAHEEASEKPVAVSQQGLPRLNYTQIFRNSWSISGTAKAVAYRTGSKLAKNKRECAMYHAEDMERTFWWGRKHIGTLNNQQLRLTDGILSQIEQYGGIVESAGADIGAGPVAGTWSLKHFTDLIRRTFKTNVKGQPNERLAFCGDLVLQALNHMTLLDSTYEIHVGETETGIEVNTVRTPFGKLKLMTHPLMNENPLWQQDLYIIHPGGIRRRILRDTFEDNYTQSGQRANGIDADEGMMTTELGIENGSSQCCAIVNGINTAVATADVIDTFS